MQLTQEHFDQQLEKLVTKEDLLLTKEGLEDKLSNQTQELKAFAREQTEELARMVSSGFKDVQDRLDVRDRVQVLEYDVGRLKEKFL